MFCGLHLNINFMTVLAWLGILNVFDLLRAACGCLHWRSVRLILKPFKYSDTLFCVIADCIVCIVCEYQLV